MDIGHPDKMIESIWIDSNKLQECVVPYSVNHGYSAVAVEVFVDYRNYRTAIHASSPLDEKKKRPRRLR